MRPAAPDGAERSSERVRVLHIGPDVDGRGGMAAVVRNLLASPLSERHRLSFVATYSTASPVLRLLVFALGSARLVRWCLGTGARVVHVHTAIRGSWYRKALCTVLAKALRRPVVLHLHSGEGDIRAFERRIGRVTRALLGAGFGRADRVLAVSEASARELERVFGLPSVTVVPNAAPPLPAKSRLNGADPHAVGVLYLGGFANRAKGADVLLAALPAVLERCPRLTITLAGPGEPPAAAQALLDSPAVHWAGYLDGGAKDAALHGAQMFVMPSRSEGLPVALLEAMAHGRAIVAARTGGIPEVVSEGEDAVLVAPEDPAALAGALVELALDAERRRRLGAAARARAERLNGDEVVDRLDATYRELAFPSRAGAEGP